MATNCQSLSHQHKYQKGYVSTYIFSLDTSSTLTWYTDLFPHTNKSDPVNSSDVLCCDPDAIGNNCSVDNCECSVEDQIRCYINDSINNLNRFYLVMNTYVSLVR